MTFNSGLILMIAVAIAGAVVQARLQSVFKKYSRVAAPGGLTGAQTAEKMLRDNGIYDVKVLHVAGRLTDHYNPVDKTLNLSDSVYASNSVAAAAVAAHECGHALQHAQGYAPLQLRSKLVPVVSISSQWAQIVLIVGLLVINVLPVLFWIGIAMFAMVLVFSLVTLPVEYNASRRALAWLDRSGMLSEADVQASRTTLTWAARTYAVAALSALVTLLYYIGIGRSRS